MLLDEQDIEILTALHLWQLTPAQAGVCGDYQSVSAGAGQEFCQYIPYCSGDDIRRVDWHHYIGKRQLVLKQADFQVRQDFYLVIDLSDSIVAGGAFKLLRSRQLAAALVFLLLQAGSVVTISDLTGQTSQRYTGKSNLLNAMSFIERLPAGGKVSPADLPSMSLSARHKDRIVLISDMLCTAGLTKLTQSLDLWPVSVTIMSLSTPQERQPQATGAVTLIDSETMHQVSLEITPARIAQYQKVRKSYFDALAHYATSRSWLYYEVCAGLEPGQMIQSLVFNNGILL